ncbi:MAG: hypothetical protein ABSA14_14935 [Acidimicrobiales bacterium]
MTQRRQRGRGPWCADDRGADNRIGEDPGHGDLGYGDLLEGVDDGLVAVVEEGRPYMSTVGLLSARLVARPRINPASSYLLAPAVSLGRS